MNIRHPEILVSHPYLVAENLRRWPVYERLIFVHTIDHQGSSSAYVIDGLIGQLFHSCSLDDDVKAIWVVFLQLGPLGTWVLAVELDVLISSIELLRDLRFYALVCRECDFPCAIQFE